MKSKTSQIQTYLEHYKYMHPSAAVKFKVFNLAEVIARLRKKGLAIEYEKDKRRYRLI